MTRARATAAPASPYGRRLRDSSPRSMTTTASEKINTNNNRRQVGPLQAVTPGPAQAVVLTHRSSYRRVEWLVGRGYLSAESIAMCFVDPKKSTYTEIKEDVPALQPA